MYDYTVTMPVGDSFGIVLEFMPAAGYLWDTAALDPEIIAVRELQVAAADDGSIGGSTTMMLIIKSLKEGITAMHHRRPWLKEEAGEYGSLTVQVSNDFKEIVRKVSKCKAPT
jgi:predicted secreted protein